MTNYSSVKAKAYWKKNIRLLILLLIVWFFISFGMAILFVDTLDEIRFFGFKLGFWMAQQGSIYCFIILIFVYVYKINKLDHQYGVDEDFNDLNSDKPLKKDK